MICVLVFTLSNGPVVILYRHSKDWHEFKSRYDWEYHFNLTKASFLLTINHLCRSLGKGALLQASYSDQRTKGLWPSY